MAFVPFHFIGSYRNHQEAGVNHSDSLPSSNRLPFFQFHLTANAIWNFFLYNLLKLRWQEYKIRRKSVFLVMQLICATCQHCKIIIKMYFNWCVSYINIIKLRPKEVKAWKYRFPGSKQMVWSAVWILAIHWPSMLFLSLHVQHGKNI